MNMFLSRFDVTLMTDYLSPHPPLDPHHWETVAGNAMLQGDEPTFLQAMAQGADPNKRIKHFSLLDWAYLRKVPTTYKKKLFEHGANPNHPDSRFWYWMMMHGTYGDLKPLIKRFGYQECKNEKHQTPLEWVLSSVHVDVGKRPLFQKAEVLMSAGASWKTQQGHSTLLHTLVQRYERRAKKRYASWVRLEEWMNMLIKHGADVNFHHEPTDTLPPTPGIIHLPSQHMNPHDWLSLGAHPQMPFYHIMPVAHRMVKEGRLSHFIDLLKHGAAMDQVDSGGRIPLMYLSNHPQTHEKWMMAIAEYEKETLTTSLQSNQDIDHQVHLAVGLTAKKKTLVPPYWPLLYKHKRYDFIYAHL